MFPNKAATDKQELLIPRTPEGEVDDKQMNRLIWGDNLLAMQALLAQGYERRLNTVYIDPPFLTSEDYVFEIEIAGFGEVTKQPSLIERLAYKDTWDDGLDSYLDMLYPRLQAIKSLLRDDGLLFLHIGQNIQHYVRVLLDEVFGVSNFVNEMIWKRTYAHGDSGQGAQHCGRLHDVIFVYSKTSAYKLNELYTDYDEDYLKSFYRHVEPGTGRRYALASTTGPGGAAKGNPFYEFLGVSRYYRFSRETMARLHGEGRIVQTSPGTVPRRKLYLDEAKGVPLQDLWTDIGPVQGSSNEYTGFDTQKPAALIERILSLGSAEGDLVADFFSGSGTTALVAERMKRRWIATDFSKLAIQVARARLVAEDASPFVIENMGNYQRELIYRERGNISLMQRLVMKLYGAQPHPAHADLGILDQKGTKVLVYVGYPDRPLTARKTAEIVKTARTLDGAGYDRVILLAWDYEYNYDEQIEIRRKGFGVQIEPRLIPPSIYDYLRKSKDENDVLDKFKEKIKFGAKPYLKIMPPEAKLKGGNEHNVALAIDKYVLAEIPIDDEKQRNELLAFTKGEKFAVLVDYWAVDWDYDGKTFRSRWQDFRGNGKGTRVVATRANTTLEGGRKYDIAVRVVDVFGNDATATTSIDLR